MGIPNGKKEDEDKVNIRMLKTEISRRSSVYFLGIQMQITKEHYLDV